MSPTATDIAIAAYVDICVRSTAWFDDVDSGKPCARFGDRKVFVSWLYGMLDFLYIDALGALGVTLSMPWLKSWLAAARLMTHNGQPLVQLARADLVAAMDPQAVAESEIAIDGATFHFVIDRTVK